ncbi:electron transport complex protein rnfA [Vibrio ishigakensis]|uniref:Electron transport complex protein rnfA n=1 Tax=Vibrio ishigakensis TaxID=1481914 RepID=A0A0B8PMD4_9VIBR|nr:electron transport complex protein rnfA [Vibrio ishigakensis]
METAIGMSLATTFVLTLASVCAYLVETYILQPLGIAYLRTMSFILVIAVVVQFTEMVVHKTSPTLYRLLGIFIPLITTNCAVLGVALLNVNENHSFIESIIYGFGAAVASPSYWFYSLLCVSVSRQLTYLCHLKGLLSR